MPRKARLDAPGTLHHVIIRGIEKRRIVNDKKDRENLVSRMGEIATETETKIFAWSLMSNHMHVLLRSSSVGLPKFMRRLLTGYAIVYNRRHSRHGHLFQNRYKSIICEEDVYFRQLVRYIHLNPIRAGLVKDLAQLDTYPWCGHGAILQSRKYPWQDTGYVLSMYGKAENQAKIAYREFVRKGLSEGRRPELVGGGLIRSQGGWSQVISMRQHGTIEKSDERILGSGEFVERIILEAEEHLRRQFSIAESKKLADRFIGDFCDREQINIKELKSGSRRRHISAARARLAKKLLDTYGMPLAEIARRLGVSTGAVSKIVNKS